MNSMNPNLIAAALLFTAAAAPACDPIDEDHALERSDDEFLADAEQADDDDAEHNGLDHLDNLAQAVDPVASYGECPASASFCFWSEIKYGGFPTVLSKGDFAINFVTPVKSMLKRNGDLPREAVQQGRAQGQLRRVRPRGQIRRVAEPPLRGVVSPADGAVGGGCSP
jgi:hypothetical protein